MMRPNDKRNVPSVWWGWKIFVPFTLIISVHVMVTTLTSRGVICATETIFKMSPCRVVNGEKQIQPHLMDMDSSR